MSDIKTAIKDYFKQPNFKSRLLIMLLGVFLLGFCLSFLLRVNFGTDPCSFMNLTISRRLGILFGTVQVLLNAFLLIFVLIWGRSYIGLGSLANMCLTGYIADFFGWIWDNVLPAHLFTDITSRIIIFALAFCLFVLGGALYTNADMGVAPYDAIPLMIKRDILKKAPFFLIRMSYDFLVLLIGILLGGSAYLPVLGAVLMVLLLGPVIQVVGGFLRKHNVGGTNV